MKFLQFLTFDVCVNMSPWEVCRRLLENIGGTGMFHGEVREDSFKVYRNMIYSDPFLPRLYGNLQSINEGTRIVITMKMFLLTKVWILFCLALIIGLIITGKLSYQAGVSMLVLIPVVTYVVLRFEARESRAAFLNFIESNVAANQEDAPA